MPEEVVERTAEEKAQMYSAILGSISVITNVLDDDNEFGSDLDAAGKKERIMRSAGYMANAVAMDDWGNEDMTAINAAIATAEAYIPIDEEEEEGEI
jgi:hypothetical protein